MHATLPKSLLAREIKKRIEDLLDGEVGSALPYNMAADAEDHLWLDPGALVTLNADSYFCVKKIREGYEVIVNPEVCTYRWERGEVDNNGELNQYTLPVAKIKVVDHNAVVNASKNGRLVGAIHD